MSDYVRGGGAPNLAGLKLKKATAKSVVTDIASAPAEPVPAPVEPAAALSPAVAPVAAPEPAQPTPAAPEPAPVLKAAEEIQPQAAAPSPETPAPPVEPEEDKLVKTSIRHRLSQARRVRATYLATMRMHRRRSLSDWLSDVLDAECSRLEAEYNEGLPFDDDPELPKGRPISS